MENYKFDEYNRFIISDYQKKCPFTNLLPGVAGPMGIPMWVFYVNRGQGITSFGTADKDHPIMEFQPANKAYQCTSLLGFRTFIKVLDQGNSVYEPFGSGLDTDRQQMTMSMDKLSLEDESDNHKLRIEIQYYTLTEEPIAGLIRQLKITNIAEEPVDLEVLDGIPVIIPYGITNQALKETSRTMEAWTSVTNQENNLPYFQLCSTPGDTSEVQAVRAGNYAYAMAIQSGEQLPVNTIVNPETVFGQDTSLRFAAGFEKSTLKQLAAQKSYSNGKTQCAVFGFSTMLPPGEAVVLHSVYGFANSFSLLNKVARQFNKESYFENKKLASQQLIQELTEPIATKTSSQLFDAYCRQTLLDNILRGGWPLQFGRKGDQVTYHIYSRKHGDPERDYNSFYLAPEFYSQGNGNYRDVNQNRRNDLWFEPRVQDTNVNSFMSLIQTDGYNPLVVKGCRFWISPAKLRPILKFEIQSKLLAQFFKKTFTPGGLLTWLEEHNIDLSISRFDFLEQALLVADQLFDAEFGEGYWTDHWTYNLDLIDSYLDIYPDMIDTFLFNNKNIPFFESPYFVQPRSKKYVLSGNHPRQYHSLIKDQEKAAMIAGRRENHNLTRTQYGLGPVFYTSLFTKLTLLAAIKFATMDPFGMGIEMEADRPGWCDALNGLPGLFGSSFSETLELSYLLEFLLENLPEKGSVDLPVEAVELIRQIDAAVKKYYSNETSDRDFVYWDFVAGTRETYREKTRFGFDGTCEPMPFQKLGRYLDAFLQKVRDGIERALLQNEGIPPTYFTYSVEKFEIIHGLDNKPLLDEKNHAYIRALSFRQNILPAFLEAPVHMFKLLKNRSEAKQLYQQIKNSELYDRTLHMYKTNVSLTDQSMEIGRLRVFTPGWLENESVFLHMEYKYMLATLRSGLYDEFFDDLKYALTAFQDPNRYGRNPLENTSFIASSAHPDPEMVGKGFIARLTGSTAEFLSMWHQMMIGDKPFHMNEGELCLKLEPSLPGWMFDEENCVRFHFLNQCTVTYFNPGRENTYESSVKIESIKLYIDDEVVVFSGSVICSPYAAMVREGKIKKIDVFLVCEAE